MSSLELSPQEIKARLRTHRVLHDLPESELDWIVAHARPDVFEVGKNPFPPDMAIEDLIILFGGQVTLYVDRGAGARRTMDWRGGDVSGVFPYSRVKHALGVTVVEERAEVLLIHRDHFPAMTRECPAFTAKGVHVMIDRARIFTQQDEHDEKMVSLGRLSAGLAHELDNPASAVLRSARLLAALLDEVEGASITLGAANIPSTQIQAIGSLRSQCVSVRAQHVRSPLAQARHEEEIADWLEEHGLRLANVEALAETTITVEMLDALARQLDPSLLQTALSWVAAGCAARTILAETGEAATRISELVKGVRAFTHRDEAATPQPVDVPQALTETLAVLRSKAKEKSVSIRIEAPPGLPKVEAVGGELNQIWSNLIDNALDAVPQGGSVDVVAKQAEDSVVVSVIDNGPGVPPENRDRIFEPFFTTKAVGQGTGQGLDIVRRLVGRRRGKVELLSSPGRTEFRVTLPIALPSEARTAAASSSSGRADAAASPSGQS